VQGEDPVGLVSFPRRHAAAHRGHAELLRAPLRRALVVEGRDWVGLLSPTDAMRSIELLNRR
jgi:hypothetical protein